MKIANWEKIYLVSAFIISFAITFFLITNDKDFEEWNRENIIFFLTSSSLIFCLFLIPLLLIILFLQRFKLSEIQDKIKLL
jgi:uncharacterized membrane protein